MERTADVLWAAWSLKLQYSVILIAVHFLKKIFAFQLISNTLEINNHVHKTISNLVSYKKESWVFSQLMYRLEHNLEIKKSNCANQITQLHQSYLVMALWFSRR